jgi:hypothetical protein
MAKWPSSSVHERFHVKPSTSTIKKGTSRQLKRELSGQDSQN